MPLGSSTATVNDPKKPLGPDHGWEIPALEPLDPLSLETRQTQMEQYQLHNAWQRRDGVKEQRMGMPGVPPVKESSTKKKAKKANTYLNQPAYMAQNEAGDLFGELGSAWPGEDYLEDDPLVNQPPGTPVVKAGSGVMVAYFLPKDIAEKLVVDGGEKPEDMHVTVAYFGKDLEDWVLRSIRMVVAEFADWFAPLQGSIGGLGLFPACESTEGRDVTVALVDVARLETLREEILNRLVDYGIQAKRNHGYTPHVTIQYHEPGEPPAVEPQTIPITIDTLTVTQGDQHWNYPMTGTEVFKVYATKGWVGVDLDGTLAYHVPHEDKHFDPLEIGKPIPKMVERVKGWLKDGHPGEGDYEATKDIRILTARVSDDPDGKIKDAIQTWCKENLGQSLPVTNEKDPHMIQLYDDKATGVERNKGVLKFNPNHDEKGQFSSGDGGSIVVYRGMSQEDYKSFKETGKYTPNVHNPHNDVTTDLETAKYYASDKVHDDPGVVVRFSVPKSSLMEDSLFHGDYKVLVPVSVKDHVVVHGSIDKHLPFFKSIERLRGQSDTELSADGEQQAQELAQHGARVGGFHRIISSDLKRAVQTVEPLAKATKTQYYTRKALRTRRWGELEGKPIDDSTLALMGYYEKNPDKRPPGKSEDGQEAETGTEFAKRVIPELHDAMKWARENPGRRMLMMTHGRLKKAFKAYIKKGQSADMSLDADTMMKKGGGKSLMHITEDSYGELSHRKVKLEKVDDLKPGVYVGRHAHTPENGAVQKAWRVVWANGAAQNYFSSEQAARAHAKDVDSNQVDEVDLPPDQRVTDEPKPYDNKLKPGDMPVQLPHMVEERPVEKDLRGDFDPE